ncbi:MAG: aminotransferase class I/II-fold pyridoxal phosphate-dependent enzyme [Gemmatimonadota bacterium]
MATSRKPARPHALATLAIHGGEGPHSPGDPVVPPLVQSVNYVQEPGGDDNLMYTRYGNTPNADRIQKRIALLEGAEAALMLASGMGATACGLLALLRPGDHLLASQFIYGGTNRLFTEEFTQMGINVTLVDPFEPRAWRRRLRKETRAIFIESPVNPTCRVLDMRGVSLLTKELGIALVVDSTFASPVNFRPLEHGADVVIHSATKFLNGHHDILGGVVCGTVPYIDEVRQKEIVWGQTPDPFACWLLERGLKTLDVRVKRQNESSMQIARWAETRKEVRRCHYPGLESHPDHEIAVDQLDGFGGMVAFELAGGARAADRFAKRLKMARYAASLGGVDTLVSEPRFSSHARLTADERAQLGIPDGFIRLSVGLEDVDDIIADLEQALR